MRKTTLTTSVVGWASVILMLFSSCSPALTARTSVKKSVLMSESARMIDEYYEEVRIVLVENGEYSQEEIASYGTLTGEEITRALSNEEGGEKYLDFLYAANNATDTEEILTAAAPFLSDEDMASLRDKAAEIEEHLGKEGERIARALNPGDKEEFYKDLRSLTVKSVVLLTAAIVYAIIPKVLFWGKVSAATAVSVASGIVASTIITIIEWSDKDLQHDENAFKDWLDNVTSEPVAAWALAQGVITTQTAAGTTPVVAALILGVFAIYQITDSTKKILKNYNWKT